MAKFLDSVGLTRFWEQVKAYVDQNMGGGGVPPGTIVAWCPRTRGEQIPAGWVICNGYNGTPSMSGRFIYGIGTNSVNLDLKESLGLASNNYHEDNRTEAKTTLTAKKAITSFKAEYFVDSETDWDKFTLTFGGTNVVDGVSGEKITSSVTLTNIAVGAAIDLSYYKDAMTGYGADGAVLFNINVTLSDGTTKLVSTEEDLLDLFDVSNSPYFFEPLTEYAYYNLLGIKDGEATHVLTAAEMPQHSHSAVLYGTGTTYTPTLSTLRYATSTSTTKYAMNVVSTTNVGSGAAHNNLPPYVRLIYIMKL